MNFIPTAIFDLYKLLPKQYKRKLAWSSVSVLVVAIIDLISIGVLLPVLLLILDENNISNNRVFYTIYQSGNFQSNESFITFICLTVFLISLFRMLFNTYIQYAQNKRLYEISNYLSLRLYQLYYSKGFLFIKQNNSLRLINKINSVASTLIQGYYIPYLSLVCELLVSALIMVGLMLFNANVFLLVMLTFVPITLGYYYFSRLRIKRYGEFLFHIFPEKNRLLQQTFVGYSDMEMTNSFSLLKEKYLELLKEQNLYTIKSTVLNTSLQRVLEFAVVCSVVVLIMSTQLFQLPSLGVIAGMFAIAVYRILPGIIKGSSYYFMVRNNTHSLTLLDEIIQTENKAACIAQREIAFEHAIRFDSVCFSYDKAIPVILNLSLEIKKGDFIGIKGKSGSGKSTLFHLLLGFLQPDSGTLYIDDTPLCEEFVNSWRSKIGYVSQQIFMIEGTIADNIMMGSDNLNRERVYEVLKLASLDKFVETLPKGLDTIVGEGGCLLSGGQRQRLGIARALYKNAEVLLFDEATSALDQENEKAINEAIFCLSQTCRDLTLLVISHRDESLVSCNRIIDITQK